MKSKYWKKFWLCATIVVITVFALAAGARARPAKTATVAASTATTSSYPIVDTGQRQCYNNNGPIACPSAASADFFGQDAQFAGRSSSYTLSSDSVTVYDQVTGLTWERSPETNGDGSLSKSDKLSYANALLHCAEHSAANYAGYNDWRLPSIKELYSLIDFSGTDPSGVAGTDTTGLTPFIDTDYFLFAYGDTSAGERLIDAQYVSSTPYVVSSGSVTKVFGVNFADGRIKGYDLKMPGDVEKTFAVQCVRGSSSYGVNDFEDNQDGTISDQATGLMWSKADSAAAMNWKNALAWVQTKNAENYLGHDDWRLPNAKELQSILDYSRSPDVTASAAIDPVFEATSFTNEDGQADWGWYWTSTTHASSNGMGGAGIYLAFGRAGGWQQTQAGCFSLVDVHGAGAQRSDPKNSNNLVEMGSICNGGTAYGLGPQGDVQRAANYVRLVRDIDGASTALLDENLYLALISANASSAKAPAFTLDQTLSDGAQRNTLAFDGLAFLTGNLGSDSFFPPGKVADFWGFQYLRDNDPSEMGHNTDFLTRAALNMLYILTPAQRSDLVALAESQVDAINDYGYQRFVLMDAFRRLLEGDLPAGASGLDQAAVQAYSAQLYRLDGEISYARAQVMGGMLNQLDATQRAYLDPMVGQGMLTWPVVDEPEDLRGLNNDVKVAVMTYAGDLFSWYAGSLEADVYFCPERQGTYFGSFYMKDAPAVGNPGYSIPVTLTAELGETFINTLTTEQQPLVTNLVAEQKTALYEIVDRREDVAVLLRQFLSGGTPDRATVLSLMEHYGELDGEIVYRYATAFAQVNQALSAEQRAKLLKLRSDLLGDLAYPSGAFLYSQSIPVPEIPNSDFLFDVP